MQRRLNIPTTGTTVTNYFNASNSDIISQIHKLLPRATKQVQGETAQFFKGNSIKSTCQNIFDFLKTNINYIPDADNQDIKLPGRFVAESVGDCKSYSLFTGAVLDALNIPFLFRYASYTADPTPQHIYVVAAPGTPDETIIDAVFGKFNQEKQYTYKKDYTMRVRTLSGINGFWSNLWQGTKIVAVSPARGAYLALVSLNVFGFATYLNALLQNNAQKLKDKWNGLGGNFTELKNAIATGKNKRAIFDKNARVAGIGVIDIAATLALATAIIAGMSALIAEGKKLFGKDLEKNPDPNAPDPNNPNNKPGQSTDDKSKGLLALAAGALMFMN